MKKYYITIFLMLAWVWPSNVFAATPPPLSVPSGLSLAEIKITGSEFVMLLNNNTAPVTDLSRYWLYVYNNVNPAAAGVNLSTQQLPAASLGSQQTLLLSANGGATCGAAVTSKLNLSLNDSGGFMQVVQTSFSGVVQVSAGDAVSWSSSSNSVAGMISNVPSNTAAPNNAYYRYQNLIDGNYLWQKADQDPASSCQLNVISAGVSTPGPVNPGSPLPPGTPPVAIFVNEVDTSGGSATSTNNIGSAAPLINELLPNPAEPQTDSEDEFIELYNPNDLTFDLSGYKLQTGTTSLRNYTFPAGTQLAGKSFKAFNASDTNLTLSNGGSQARLLDPTGNVISQSEPYGSAKDGQSWSLADGKWYWTKNPTPNQTNVINGSTTAAASTASSKKSSTGAATKNNGKVKAASTVAEDNQSSDPPQAGQLHPLVLAGVGIMAVAYAAYEYRHDLANRLHQFRRYRETRATARAGSGAASSAGTGRRFGCWQDDFRTWLGTRLGK